MSVLCQCNITPQFSQIAAPVATFEYEKYYIIFVLMKIKILPVIIILFRRKRIFVSLFSSREYLVMYKYSLELNNDTFDPILLAWKNSWYDLIRYTEFSSLHPSLILFSRSNKSAYLSFLKFLKKNAYVNVLTN